LAEHLLCKQGVGGSSPLVSTAELALIPMPPRVTLAVDAVAGEWTSGPLLRDATTVAGRPHW
jgi:hypothetical protein